MHLTHRPLTPEDLDACFAIRADQPDSDGRAQKHLTALWRFLLESGCGESDYITDRDGPEPYQPLAFGISAFITDKCCEALRKFPQPGVSLQVLERWLRGESPFPNEDQRRTANTDAGLNLLILGRGSPAPGSAHYYHVSRALMDGFYAAHRGYNLREVLAECFGQSILTQFRLGGWEMRADYREYYAGRGLPLPPPEQQPFLMGLTRAEATADPGRSIATLFDYIPPRFFFRPGEQAQLRRALSGDTDQELAQRMEVSLWTVKKRWNVIYERVAAVAPDLLPEAEEETASETKRGAEKRRRLLGYLRDHWEELRPLRAGSRDGRGSPDSRLHPE